MSDIINEIEDVCFGDKRVDQRAKQVLQSLYKGVGNGLSASLGGNSELKAAYRFFDNELVNPNEILMPHYAMTLERIREHKVVVLAQDTTDIDMKHMEKVENLGFLNDTKRPGCLFHPVVAFTIDKLCLGIVNTKFMIRPEDELGKKIHNNLREIEDKESYRWIEGYQAACKIAEQCPDTLCISVGDRESDIYELLLEATNGKAKLLTRAWHDRSVLLPPTNKMQELMDENQKLVEENKTLATINEKLRNKKNSFDYRKTNTALIKTNKIQIKKNKETINKDISLLHTFKNQLYEAPIIGTVDFILPEGRGRKSRLVKQNIRTTKVVLQPSQHKKNLPKVTINAVLLEEIETPQGEDPISWMFLTTLPNNTQAEIQFIISVYLSRWGIELFFKVLKSGCKIEELRFQEASRLLACISIYLIVAWRILYATFIGRTCPELPCSILFELDEWHAVYASTKKAQPPDNPPSLGKFIEMIATLGGYRGRKTDGPPGMKVIWIGINMMYRVTEGWQAFREFGQNK